MAWTFLCTMEQYDTLSTEQSIKIYMQEVSNSYQLKKHRNIKRSTRNIKINNYNRMISL